MPREKEGYRDELEQLLLFFGEKRVLTIKDAVVIEEMYDAMNTRPTYTPDMARICEEDGRPELAAFVREKLAALESALAKLRA